MLFHAHHCLYSVGLEEGKRLWGSALADREPFGLARRSNFAERLRLLTRCVLDVLVILWRAPEIS
jgi:hypothetical protein